MHFGHGADQIKVIKLKSTVYSYPSSEFWISIGQVAQ